MTAITDRLREWKRRRDCLNEANAAIERARNEAHLVAASLDVIERELNSLIGGTPRVFLIDGEVFETSLCYGTFRVRHVRPEHAEPVGA